MEDEEAVKVWRYMSFGRFVWMLQRRALWLSRVDMLGDPWEMAPSEEQWAGVLQTARKTATRQRSEAEIFQRRKRDVMRWRQQMFVNCWSACPHESHALWRIYCLSVEGVAVQTTLARLRESLQALQVHRVTYADPQSIREDPQLEQLTAQKRPMFAYEQEVRVLLNSGELAKGLTWEASFGRRRGVMVGWEPETVLESIYVHPEADDAFFQTVQGTVEQYCPTLKTAVRWSAMQARPLFF